MKTDISPRATMLEGPEPTHSDAPGSPAECSGGIMESENVPGGFNPSQIRALTAALQVVEHAVDEVERLLATAGPGVTTWWRDDLTSGEDRLLRQLMAQLRGRLATACLELGIRAEERSVRRTIRGTLAVLWATLEDSRAVNLCGYGTVPAGLGSVLDATMAALSADVCRILRVVEGTGVGPRAKDRGTAATGA